MKNFWGTLVCLFIVTTSYSQYTVKGRVALPDKTPVPDATISLEKNGAVINSTATDGDGSYAFKNIKKGTYRLSTHHVSLANYATDIIINGPTQQDIELKQNAYFLEPLEIKAVRAADKAPFAKTEISKEQLQKINQGQDLPFLLNQTPGVVVNSDAGNGIGYTGIRIRGSDATRINVTLNGIPYNDAESQGSYFVDVPDLASSTNSIQVQRGVGSSSNGAGAFGASINVSTNEFNEKAYGETSNSFGSFNSWKNTVRAGSGLLNNHFTIDARLSRISSDGYMDRASSNFRSLYLSGAYVSKNTTLRFNFISGTEKTYQAWNGVPESMLKTDRTFNSAGTEKPGEPYNNETDNYQQDHYQLFLNHAFNSKLSFNTALFFVRGKGYYEQYKGVQAEQNAGSTSNTAYANYGLPNFIRNTDTITNTDLVRQLWLDNSFYGQILSLQYKSNADQLTVGGGWNEYDGTHYGRIVWAMYNIPKDYEWYRLPAYKTDVNMYAKWTHTFSRHLDGYADLQYRFVNYRINGFEDNPAIFIRRKFSFFNPKAGLTYTNNGWQAYVSYALANKEPNRDDFEAGKTRQPKYETLHDIEAGLEKRFAKFGWGANLYYMRYHNQLILTGQINDVGAYTRVNVPQSYRLGIELQARANIATGVSLAGNIAFSRNKISQSEEFIDDYDNGGQKLINHSNTDISFSPAVVGGATLTLTPVKNGEISLVSKYVSRQYLDNTQDKSRSLNPYYVQDTRFSYTFKNVAFKEWTLGFSVFNVFNKKYEPNGYTFSYVYGGNQTTENYYFPMAGTNVMGTVSIKL